jgi:PAS domain S-box-containing protein
MKKNILFSQLFDSMPGMAVFTDNDFNLLYYNDRFEQFFGITSDSGNLSLNRCVSESLAAKISKRFNENSGRQHPPITASVNNGKFRMDVEITVKKVSAGKIFSEGFLVFFNDISEKKHLEYDLLSTMKVIDNSPASIVITDPTGVIEFVNKRFSESTGYSKKEVLGKNPRLLKSGSQDEEFYKNMWVTVLDGREWRGEFHNIRKNGESFWEISSISPIKDRSGRIQRLIAVKEDISHLKKVEEDLKISEERNRGILQAIPDVMFNIDREGRCRDKFMESKAEEVFPAGMRQTAMTVIKRALDNYMPEVFEYPVYADGVLNYYEARFIATDEWEILVIVRNITERVQAEEQIKKARDEAEAANSAKSAFLANMSHEIRTPLNSIMGFIELLHREKLDRHQKEYLSIVSRSAESLLGIINDILDFSKIESRKLDIESVVFSPFAEFESVINLFHARAAEKNIQLIPYLDPALPSFLTGDPLRIKQILSNLLSNAVKFTQEGGHILVEIKTESVSAGTAEISFSVTDDGIGIPERKRDIIFQAFGQADSSVSRKYGGTGLGLAISNSLVSLMGSALMLESEPGKGSRFFFTLNMGASSSSEDFTIIVKDNSVSSVVLTAEKEPSMQEKVILRYLESFGCTPVFSHTDIPQKINLVICIEEAGPPEYLITSLKQNPGQRAVLVTKERRESALSDISYENLKIIRHPVNASNLYDAVADLFGIKHERGKGFTGGTLDESPFYEARILVAEDNIVNQKLIILMLEAFGIKADIASNGLSAYEMACTRIYDMILMDVNMPVADGIESTGWIIEHEKNNSLDHVPIVALTAKAIKGDREHLLASGMDDYLAKPVSFNSLGDVLKRYLSDLTRARPDAHPSEPEHSVPDSAIPETVSAAESEADDVSPDESGWDLKYTASILGISEKMVKMILKEFIESSDENMRELSAAVDSGDPEQIYQAAHKIKGAAANLRINGISVPVAEIEAASHSGESFDYNGKLELIKQEIQKIRSLI